jgi:hypothetical protein
MKRALFVVAVSAAVTLTLFWLIPIQKVSAVGMAFDAQAGTGVSRGNYVNGPQTATWAHVIAGPNPFAGVCVWEDTAGQISSPQYNGVALTAAVTDYHDTTSGVYMSLYYTSTAPATGTHNFSFTYAGGQHLAIGWSYANSSGFDAKGSGSQGTAALAFDAVTRVNSSSWAGTCNETTTGTTPTQGDGTNGSSTNVLRGTDNLGGYMSWLDSNGNSLIGGTSMKYFTQPDHVSTHAFGAVSISIAPVAATATGFPVVY